MKVGSLVYFDLVLDWSAHTGTGNMRVAGFPYAQTALEPYSNNWTWATTLTITGQATLGFVPSQTYGDLGAINNGTFSALAMDAAAFIRVTGFYATDS